MKELLSSREREIIKYACEGLTDKAIGAQLGLTDRTVSTYWERIRVKTGASNKTHCVALLLLKKCEALESEVIQLRRGLDAITRERNSTASDQITEKNSPR